MKTLICIRQLPFAEPTVRFGGLISGLEQSPMTLMTVIDDEADREKAAADLAQASALVDNEGVLTKVRRGRAVEEILSESAEGNYDIVVLGARDVGLLDALLGSVTGKVTDRAASSVLIVKDGRPQINKILVAIGGQKMNPEVVKTGARLARSAGAKVTLLFVTNPVPTMYTGLEGIEETLDELLQTDTPVSRYLHWSAEYMDEKGVSAELKVVQGVASDEIIREAQFGGYDLLVIGARALQAQWKRLFVDQVTPHVVERPPCPVLVVR